MSQPLDWEKHNRQARAGHGPYAPSGRPPIVLGQWPGATPLSHEKANVTMRAKRVPVTLAPISKSKENRRMSPEVHDAIENAVLGTPAGNDTHARPVTFERARHLLLRIARDLPEGMTVGELREELELANNQGYRG